MYAHLKWVSNKVVKSICFEINERLWGDALLCVFDKWSEQLKYNVGVSFFIFTLQ